MNSIVYSLFLALGQCSYIYSRKLPKNAKRKEVKDLRIHFFVFFVLNYLFLGYDNVRNLHSLFAFISFILYGIAIIGFYQLLITSFFKKRY